MFDLKALECAINTERARLTRAGAELCWGRVNPPGADQQVTVVSGVGLTPIVYLDPGLATAPGWLIGVLVIGALQRADALHLEVLCQRPPLVLGRQEVGG